MCVCVCVCSVYVCMCVCVCVYIYVIVYVCTCSCCYHQCSLRSVLSVIFQRSTAFEQFLTAVAENKTQVLTSDRDAVDINEVVPDLVQCQHICSEDVQQGVMLGQVRMERPTQLTRSFIILSKLIEPQQHWHINRY